MADWFSSQGVNGYASDPSQVQTTMPVGSPVEGGAVPGTLSSATNTQYDPSAGGGSTGALSPATAASGGADPYAGLNPQLAAIYKQYGVTPGGPGSGLTDASYWNNKFNTGDAGYFAGRLSSDFSGGGPDAGGGGGGGSFSAGPVNAPNVSLPSITAGVSMPGPSSFDLPTQGGPVGYTPFSYGSFKPPTAADVQSDPGYAFGMDQGTKALQANQAAQGILKTGGAAKGLEQYGNDYATTKYDDAYQRALNTFNTNYGAAFGTSQANNAGNLNAFQANTNANLGYGNLAATRAGMLNQYNLGAGQLALSGQTANQNYALGGANVNLGYYNTASNYALGMANVGLGYGNLGLGYYNAGNTNALNQNYYGLAAQGQNFNQQSTLAGMGLGAAESTNTAAGQYGANASGLITGQGNANAAGVVGASNATNAGYGAAANAAIGAYGYYQMNPQQTTTYNPATYNPAPTSTSAGFPGAPTSPYLPPNTNPVYGGGYGNYGYG